MYGISSETLFIIIDAIIGVGLSLYALVVVYCLIRLVNLFSRSINYLKGML